MAATENGREVDDLAVRLKHVKPLPIFGRAAAKKVKVITNKYQLPIEPSLDQALTTIYFSHIELWPRPRPDSRAPRLRQRQDSRALKRSAAKINTATRKYMSALGANSTFAQLLCAGLALPDHLPPRGEDVSALIRLLQRLEFNSRIATRAKAALGRRKDQLAVTVAAELGQLYDHYLPSSRRMLRGVSRSSLRREFVHDTLKLFDLDLSEDSIRTYREEKHTLRVRS
jgi:hypothetical protein